MLPYLMVRVCKLSIGYGPFRAGVVLVGIYALIEEADAKVMHGVSEALVFAFTVADIGFDQRADHVRNFRGGKRRADDVAEVGVIALATADRDLVPLGAALVDAEDADVADVMVPAGVHAAGDVEVKFGD